MSKSSLSNLIIGGDWNATLQTIDKKGGIQWKPTAYRRQIISMMKELIWQMSLGKTNTNKKSFTYESVAQKLKSWIEFFWLPNLSPVDTKTSIALDHKAVKLRLSLINSKHGPGL